MAETEIRRCRGCGVCKPIDTACPFCEPVAVFNTLTLSRWACKCGHVSDEMEPHEAHATEED